LQKSYLRSVIHNATWFRLQPASGKTPWYKNRWLVQIVVPVLIVLAVGAGVGLAGLGTYQLATGTNLFNTSTGSLGVPSSASVSMPKGVGGDQSLNFQPASLTIAKGGKVTWTNNDVANHTVTSTTTPSGAASFNSGNMAPNATYTATFTVDGTYKYFCAYHYWMTGTITVTG